MSGLKEKLGISGQHIRQPEYEKIEVERYLRTCTKGMFKFLSSKLKKITKS